MKSKIQNNVYHTVRTVPKSNRIIVITEAKTIPLTHIDIPHSPDLVQTSLTLLTWYRHLSKSYEIK